MYKGNCFYESIYVYLLCSLQVNRRHSIEEGYRALRLLKNNCFKVDIHLMPDLPGATPEKVHTQTPLICIHAYGLVDIHLTFSTPPSFSPTFLV